MNFSKLYDNLDPYVASILNDHHHAISMISNGVNLWKNKNIECLRSFKTFIETSWFPFASTTHFVEAGVKEAKMCTLPKRDESVRTNYATVRRFIIYEANKNEKAKQTINCQHTDDKPLIYGIFQPYITPNLASFFNVTPGFA